MQKLDLRKELKHLYAPSAKQVQLVDVPEMQFAMIDGAIEPGSEPGLSPAFAEALQALYGISFTLWIGSLEAQIMEPKFVSLPAFTLVGMMMRVKPQGKVPGQLWDEFGPRMDEIRHVTGSAMSYGLTDNMDMGSGEFDYMAAMQVSSAEDIPTGMTAYDVPAQTYAVFPCTIPTLRDVFDQIYGVWLPSSGYARTDGPELELYGETFDPRDPAAVFGVYIPVFRP